MKKHSLVSWVVFAAGIGLITFLQIKAVTIVYPYWGWNKSHFAKHFFWPLLGFAFVLCLLAPLLTKGPLARRFVSCLFAGLVAATVYAALAFAILSLYGV